MRESCSCQVLLERLRKKASFSHALTDLEQSWPAWPKGRAASIFSATVPKGPSSWPAVNPTFCVSAGCVGLFELKSQVCSSWSSFGWNFGLCLWSVQYLLLVAVNLLGGHWIWGRFANLFPAGQPMQPRKSKTWERKLCQRLKKKNNENRWNRASPATRDCKILVSLHTGVAMLGTVLASKIQVQWRNGEPTSGNIKRHKSPFSTFPVFSGFMCFCVSSLTVLSEQQIQKPWRTQKA